MENKAFVPPRPPRELQKLNKTQEEENKIENQNTQEQNLESVSLSERPSNTNESEETPQASVNFESKNPEKISEISNKNTENIEKNKKNAPKIPTPPKFLNKNASKPVVSEPKKEELILQENSTQSSQKIEDAKIVENAMKFENSEKIGENSEKNVKKTEKTRKFKPKAEKNSHRTEMAETEVAKKEKKKFVYTNTYNWVMCGVSGAFFVLFLVLLLI